MLYSASSGTLVSMYPGLLTVGVMVDRYAQTYHSNIVYIAYYLYFTSIEIMLHDVSSQYNCLIRKLQLEVNTTPGRLHTYVSALSLTANPIPVRM